MRVIIDLPDWQIEALERLGRSRKWSRAEMIRPAVERYVQENVPAREEAMLVIRNTKDFIADAPGIRVPY